MSRLISCFLFIYSSSCQNEKVLLTVKFLVQVSARRHRERPYELFEFYRAVLRTKKKKRKKKKRKKEKKKDIRSWRLRSRRNQKFTSVFQPWNKFRDEFITRNKIIRIIDRPSDRTDRLTFYEDFLKFVNLSTPFDCLLISFFFYYRKLFSKSNFSF